jgi:FkbM family methyltransferase
LTREQLYLGDHTFLTQLIHGPKIFIDSRDNVNIWIILNGVWEKGVTQHFLSAVKTGMTVLDIGAHCGYFSLLAAKQVGPTGKVHSFEPNPFYHYNFLRSMSLNGYTYVHLNKVALASQKGTMKLLQFAKEGEVGPSISPFGVNFPHDYHEYTVETANLIELLPDKKADVIKIDIDGGEPYIMESLFQIIEYNPSLTIFLEYLPMLWKDQDPMSILQRFAAYGFNFKIIQQDGTLVPTTIQRLANYNGPFHLDLILQKHG